VAWPVRWVRAARTTWPERSVHPQAPHRSHLEPRRGGKPNGRARTSAQSFSQVSSGSAAVRRFVASTGKSRRARTRPRADRSSRGIGRRLARGRRAGRRECAEARQRGGPPVSRTLRRATGYHTTDPESARGLVPRYTTRPVIRSHSRVVQGCLGSSSAPPLTRTIRRSTPRLNGSRVFAHGGRSIMSPEACSPCDGGDHTHHDQDVIVPSRWRALNTVWTVRSQSRPPRSQPHATGSRIHTVWTVRSHSRRPQSQPYALVARSHRLDGVITGSRIHTVWAARSQQTAPIVASCDRRAHPHRLDGAITEQPAPLASPATSRA